MSKRALVALPVAGLGLLALAACSPSTPVSAPSTPSTTVLITTASRATTTSPPTTTSSKAAATPVTDNGCKVNPATEPMPTAPDFEQVPIPDHMQVTLSGVPSGTVKATGAPVEVAMTVCNSSPVNYPSIGFVLALAHCSCAPGPQGMAKGTVQRFDAASGSWIDMPHPYIGGGMDYLGGYSAQQPLPKGKSVTVRYRFSYDPSMTAGQGGLEADVVVPEGNHLAGGTRLSFAVTH